MNLNKIESGGVWVKASVELPTENGWYFIKRTENYPFAVYLLPHDATGFYLPEKYEWLKPIKDVYVFTSDELEKIMWDYGNNCANDGSSFSELTKPKQFLESIKQ